MCGFAGIISWDDRFHVAHSTLERMSKRIAHRGPDGRGIYLNHDGEASPRRPQVGLAHRRLAILDPNPRADQPLADKEGRWIVFNGEIYNFRELREELSSLSPGHLWHTAGDTEVLLAAYARWGEQCVDRLNGMFAFAIWDEPEGRLFLARDRMGQKPLYVASPAGAGAGGAVAFASELGALREIPWFSAEIRSESLREYLRWGYIGGESTIYASAGKVAPATWRMYRFGREERGSYFCVNESRDSSARTPSTARERILTAVGRQLVSDVPIGCFLSGGMDSSVIAAAMRRKLPADVPLLTFSIGFDDPRYDETRHAAAVARHLGTRHEQFIVRPDAAADLPALAAVFGEPFGDSSALPTHYLSRETRQRVKVALSGDGGDEMFGGYDRYRAMEWDRWIRCVPGAMRGTLGGALGRMARVIPGSNPKSMSVRVKRFLSSIGLSSAKRYSSYVRLFSDERLNELFGGGIGAEEDHIALLYGGMGRDPVAAALATDRITYLPDDLLAKVDRCSMLHALEVRSPFMDHEVMRFAAGLSADQLIGGGPKRMLREGFGADLPAWVFKRAKMGFAVPIGEWFRGELRAMLRDHLFADDSFASGWFARGAVERLVEEHESRRCDHSQRLYALLMLELWWRLQRA